MDATEGTPVDQESDQCSDNGTFHEGTLIHPYSSLYNLSLDRLHIPCTCRTACTFVYGGVSLRFSLFLVFIVGGGLVARIIFV